MLQTNLKYYGNRLTSLVFIVIVGYPPLKTGGARQRPNALGGPPLKSPDRGSNNSTPAPGSVSSEESEKPTFSLGEK